MSVSLILGGARSGKSSYAETCVKNEAKEMGKGVVYIATSSVLDDQEWQQRVHLHQQQRPQAWHTIEEPLQLAKTIQKQKDVCVLVDCLTLWLSNIMVAELPVQQEIETLCETLEKSENNIFLVSNELGMGLVPETSLGRAFRDGQGQLNKAVAEVADKVELVVAGLPVVIKGEK